MKNQTEKRSPIKLLFANTRQFTIFLFLGFLTILLYSLNRQFLTYLLGSIVDSAIDKSLFFSSKEMLFFGLSIVTGAILGGLRHYFANIYCNKSLYQLRKKTIESAENYSLQYLSKLSSGSFISKMNNSLNEVEKFLKDTIFNTAFYLITGIGAIILGFFTNFQMTLFLIFIAAALTFFAERIARTIKHNQKELLKVDTTIGGIAQDSINGHIEVKSFNLYSVLENKLISLIDKATVISHRIVKADNISESTLLSVSFSMQVIIVLIGLLFTNRGTITLGDVVIFQQILNSMKRIWRIDFFSFNKTASSMNHLFELWAESDVTHWGKIVSGINPREAICLKNVSFKYDSDDRDFVINELSLKINKGETVAIVGGSGCGKSTLLKLIAGFYSPVSGEIFHQGIEYSQWDIRELRRRFSIVEQSPYLFPATIAENIECGLIGYLPKDCFHRQIKEAAERADIDSFINMLPQGYDTAVGENGITLSGGQKQKISIARAFLKDAEIFLLDEPSSALDAESESKIDLILEKHINNKTTIIVSHRFSTIRRASRILVLDQGSISEEGNHEELMSKQGIYYQLYNNQIFDARTVLNESE